MKERLQKVLAARGVASRRASERLISEGAVTVNGVTADIGMSVDPERDDIRVNGAPLPDEVKYKYIILNKPRGVITSLSDEKGRNVVKDLLPESLGRLVPAGRLDYNTEGLLVMTNDGEAVKILTHPSHGVEKTYHAGVHGNIPEAVKLLSRPMTLDDTRIKAVNVRIIGRDLFAITISEGKNRQIRRMCEQAGLKVVSLVRVREGELELGDLRPGQFREFNEKESEWIKALKKRYNNENV